MHDKYEGKVCFVQGSNFRTSIFEVLGLTDPDTKLIILPKFFCFIFLIWKILLKIQIISNRNYCNFQNLGKFGLMGTPIEIGKTKI